MIGLVIVKEKHLPTLKRKFKIRQIKIHKTVKLKGDRRKIYYTSVAPKAKKKIIRKQVRRRPRFKQKSMWN